MTNKFLIRPVDMKWNFLNDKFEQRIDPDSNPPVVKQHFGQDYTPGIVALKKIEGNKVIYPLPSIDILASMPVFAVADGIITLAEDARMSADEKRRACGIWIAQSIVHESTQYYVYYMHLAKILREIKFGSKVKQGQQIGIMGNTGKTTGQHLHFQLMKGGYGSSNAINPEPYFA